jgi:5-methyltetrahydropteroyltriglutamate--homocysteine methyltransferase
VIVAHTDVVGSLLRLGGEIGPPEFKRVEDAAVAEATRLQEGIGLAVVTDGEMRRLSFQSQLTEARLWRCVDLLCARTLSTPGGRH